jgi:hypothetical protein
VKEFISLIGLIGAPFLYQLKGGFWLRCSRFILWGTRITHWQESRIARSVDSLIVAFISFVTQPDLLEETAFGFRFSI